MARLGGVLQVVLALWSRLGGRMGPFGADLEPEGGAIFLKGGLGGVSDVTRPGQGSALGNSEKNNQTTDWHSNTPMPCRHGGGLGYIQTEEAELPGAPMAH